ncbi:MAG: protein kinase [Bacillota bacterium]|nr:protein kinase [Bacillota bacterium]
MDNHSQDSIHQYEPLFGSWYVTKPLDHGASGRLYQIHKVDSVGHDSYSALKVITIPADGETEVRSVMASGVSREELEDYYQGVIANASSEFTILSRLKGNTNIVSYEDHEIIRHEDSFGWDILIRMEQITPLLDYSLEHELSEDEVLKMGIDICHGLALCASHKIIHRDIKPENIFVTDNGDFKIGDFGIARIMEQTQTSMSRKGTYTYMAPEMFRGDPYTENVDLYSLGLVMYRYLNNGRGPFMPDYPKPIVYEDSEKAFTQRMSGYDIPEPAHGSPLLKRIVLKACTYESKDRYASAEEMLDDLEVLLEEGKQEARREKRLASLPRYKRKLYRFLGRRKKVIAAVIILLLLCGGGAFALEQRGVTSIEGIDANQQMLIDDTMAPEYSVKPFWFGDETIRFSSSDENVITVDKKGRITAVGTGSAVLTMKAADYTGYVQIQVDPKVTKIANVSDVELYAGDTSTLKPKLSPDKYADEKITYTSADKSIATVSDKGKITAKETGGTVITITAGGAAKTINVIVMSAPVRATGGSSSSGGSSKKSSGGSGHKGDYFGDDEYF